MKKILVVFTGGTIGSVANNGTINTDGSAPYTLLEKFVQHYPNHHDCALTTIQPFTLLSENLNPRIWTTLVEAIKRAQPELYDGIIITHGTDTLAYTAAALSFCLAGLTRPVLLVSSDYTLADPHANGVANFICAVEYIRQQKPSGVFVPYRNPQQTTQVHHGARLASCLQLSGDFISVQNKVYLQFKNLEFSSANVELTKSIPATPLPANFSERILLIKPYPGLDYRYFNLIGVDAVLHDLYHSGTACVTAEWGVNHSLVEFIKRCGAEGVKVYLAPILKAPDAYQTIRILQDIGAEFIWNMSIEAAYVKLALAYGQLSSAQAITEFMAVDIAGERV